MLGTENLHLTQVLLFDKPPFDDITSTHTLNLETRFILSSKEFEKSLFYSANVILLTCIHGLQDHIFDHFFVAFRLVYVISKHPEINGGTL